MPDQVTSSPLSWPQARPRTQPGGRRTPPFGSGFSHRTSEFTIAEAATLLTDEMRRLGVPDHGFILSTNLRLRVNDGMPLSNQRQPDDPGAAVYFKVEDTPTVISCDRWLKVQDNIFAIAKHIDALRGQDRWGCGSVREAFAGYAALPPPIAGDPPRRHWREVMGFETGLIVNADALSIRYRALAKKLRGDETALRDLNVARDQARGEIG